jgi:hypothetical protein
MAFEFPLAGHRARDLGPELLDGLVGGGPRRPMVRTGDRPQSRPHSISSDALSRSACVCCVVIVLVVAVAMKLASALRAAVLVVRSHLVLTAVVVLMTFIHTLAMTLFFLPRIASFVALAVGLS